MVMIIPGKGYNVKIALQDIKDLHIKKELKNNFPNSIYKGEYSIIMDNLENKVFGGY
jgi:formiminotetrahydrofolate cyclodeaminase